MPLVSRTRATLRSAEFGFFGVCVNTRTHTPRFCGLLCSAGLFVLVRTLSRPLRTSWLIVGIPLSRNRLHRRASVTGRIRAGAVAPARPRTQPFAPRWRAVGVSGLRAEARHQT